MATKTTPGMAEAIRAIRAIRALAELEAEQSRLETKLSAVTASISKQQEELSAVGVSTKRDIDAFREIVFGGASKTARRASTTAATKSAVDQLSIDKVRKEAKKATADNPVTKDSIAHDLGAKSTAITDAWSKLTAEGGGLVMVGERAGRGTKYRWQG